MVRLYTGLADAYKMNQNYSKQIDALLTLYREYAPRRHSLLYTAAFSACYHQKDYDHTIQLLEAYLRTRPKESQQPVTPDEDYVITGDRYNAAENWLNDLRKSKKIEDFFEGHVTP